MIMKIKIVILFIFIFLTGCGVTHVNYTGDYKGSVFDGQGEFTCKGDYSYKGEWKNRTRKKLIFGQMGKNILVNGKKKKEVDLELMFG